LLQTTDEASVTIWQESPEEKVQELVHDRVLGRLIGEEPGPTLIWIGGLHGNEPAGVEAIERLFEELQGREDKVHGEVLGLAGNRGALTVGQRFIEKDLNRIWSKERLEELRAGHLGPLSSPEDRELVELWTELEAAFSRARGPIYVVDFHTTSGPGCGFAVIPDTLHSRSFAMSFPVPSILGLEEEVEGTVADYLGERGFVVVGFEGGKHDEPLSVDHCAAAGWISLAVSGTLPEEQVLEVVPSQQLLHHMGGGLRG
jgi:predicted deacylase